MFFITTLMLTMMLHSAAPAQQPQYPPVTDPMRISIPDGYQVVHYSGIVQLDTVHVTQPTVFRCLDDARAVLDFSGAEKGFQLDAPARFINVEFRNVRDAIVVNPGVRDVLFLDCAWFGRCTTIDGTIERVRDERTVHTAIKLRGNNRNILVKDCHFGFLRKYCILGEKHELGTNRVLIHNVTTEGSIEEHLFRFLEGMNITIMNSTLRSPQATQVGGRWKSADGVRTEMCKNVRITNCRFEGSYIRLGRSSGGKPLATDAVRITDCTFLPPGLMTEAAGGDGQRMELAQWCGRIDLYERTRRVVLHNNVAVQNYLRDGEPESDREQAWPTSDTARQWTIPTTGPHANRLFATVQDYERWLANQPPAEKP